MNGFEHFGEELQREIEDAISTGNFRKLNASVTDTLERAAGTVYDKISGGLFGQGRYGRMPGNPSGFPGAEGPYPRGFEGRRESMATGSGPVRVTMAPVLYTRNTGYRLSGIILNILGAGGLTVSLGLMLLIGISAVFPGDTPVTAVAAAELMMGILAVFSGILLAGGVRMSRRAGRFARYVAVLGNREYADVKELAAAVRKPEKATCSDLRWMIGRRWFLQGHMDAEQKCLMTTHHMYEEYMKLEEQRSAQREEQEKNERERMRQEQKFEKMPAHVRDVLKQGNDFIKEIRVCNDRIPGEEISAKIDRMERIVRTIFERLEKEPRLVGDVQKLLDYYLPMSVKLLKAYEDMDGAPVKGEHILSSMREIEKTIDTINQAFEKLLDELFLKISWDVSSDIAVLNTMFSQEGLAQEKKGEEE